MRYDWIMDVLTDLRNFSAVNGLTDLSRELDATLTIAAKDISRAAGVPILAYTNTDLPTPEKRGGTVG